MIALFEWKSGGADPVLSELFLLAWVRIEYAWQYREERANAEFVDMGGEA